jgi:hypothetical protein
MAVGQRSVLGEVTKEWSAPNETQMTSPIVRPFRAEFFDDSFVLLGDFSGPFAPGVGVRPATLFLCRLAETMKDSYEWQRT